MSTSLNVTITGNAASLTSAMQQVQTSTKQTMTTMTQETTKAQGAFAKLTNFFSGGMRGLTFGLTGMVTAGIEAVGMFSMLQDSQQRVTDAQAELNDMQAQGITSGSDYQRVTNELEKAQRALRFSMRFTILSFADMIPFVLNTVNSLVKVRTAAAENRVAMQALGTTVRTTGAEMAVFGTQQKLAATSAMPLATALKAQQVQMSVGSKSALGMAVGYQAMEKGAIGATVATNGLKLAIKGALIATGIGAAIVLITSYMEAYANNTMGARDRTNELGKAIGDAVPPLRGFLDALKSAGEGALKFLGMLPTEATDKVKEMSDKMKDDILKNMDDIREGHQALVEEFRHETFGEGHKGWKEQFKFLKELGFDKEGIHHIKFAIEVETGEIDVINKITKGLRAIKDFKLPPGDIRKWANNTIDDIANAVREAGGQSDWFDPLKDLVRKNKKNPNLPKLVAQWFAGLPAEVQQHLTDIGLPPDEIIKAIGFEPIQLRAELQKVLATTFATPSWATALKGVSPSNLMQQIQNDPEFNGNIGLTAILFGDPEKEKTPANDTGKTIGDQIVAGLAGAFTLTPELRTAINALFTTIINYAKTWGVAAGQWFGIGWSQATEFAGQLSAWFNTAFSAVAKPVVDAAALFAKAFGDAWALATTFGTSLLTWFGEAFKTVAKPVTDAAVLFAEAFSTAWAEVTSFGTNLLTWFGSAFETVAKPVVDVAVKFAEAFSASWTTVTTLGSDLITWISDAITGTISTVIEKGKDIGTAIWTGMKSVLDGLQQTIMDFGGTIGGWIVDAIKQIFPDFDLQNPLAKPKPGVTPTTPKVTQVNVPPGGGTPPPQLEVDNSQAIAQVGDIAIAIAKLATLKPEIGVNPSPALLSVADIAIAMAKVSTFKPEIDVNNGPALLTVADIAIAMAKLSTFQPPIDVNNKPGIKAIDVIAKRIDSLTGINPQIPVNNKPAIKAVDVIAKRIDSLTGINPGIPVNNKPAIKAVDVIAKRIDSLSKIVPPINVNNKPALKAIDVIAHRIETLPDGDVTVRVHHVDVAQGGMHETLAHDTTIQAHKGERVEIWPVGQQGQTIFPNTKREGTTTYVPTGMSGNIEIVNVIMDERIVRKTKMQMGKNTYTMR